MQFIIEKKYFLFIKNKNIYLIDDVKALLGIFINIEKEQPDSMKYLFIQN
jgi:adenylate cyclase class IV